MWLAFSEYHIDSIHRAKYMSWAEKMTGRYPSLRIYEGTDQPGLFVEVWEGMEHTAFQAVKSYRVEEIGEGDADLLEMKQWLAQGKERIHMWHFHKAK